LFFFVKTGNWKLVVCVENESGESSGEWVEAVLSSSDRSPLPKGGDNSQSRVLNLLRSSAAELVLVGVQGTLFGDEDVVGASAVLFVVSRCKQTKMF
jgi:hypothetical protein